MLKHEKNEKGIYNPVMPNIEDWPIHKLSQERELFIEQLTDASTKHLTAMAGGAENLHQEIAKALYLERIRIKTEPWAVDPPDDKAFWHKVNQTLVETSLSTSQQDRSEENAKVLQQIIARYANEIVGRFEPSIYHRARKILTSSFAQLFNTISTPRLFGGSKSGKSKPLGGRLSLVGNAELIRDLSLKGTLLIVPTHFSNLDSVLIGWAIQAWGLPSVQYGAGWNLFNSKFFAYFMDRLGAYKVDRRKKNSLYIETLKMYSRMTLQKGCHSLFFPGGTRARSGQIETRLKLGLLGTAVDAQRLNFVEAISNHQPTSTAGKIFIVPLVLNYHFVLEANSLIEEHLRRRGKESYYIIKSDFPSTRKMTSFISQFLWKKSEVFLSFGKPRDIFGYEVNKEGESLDKNGNVVDISQYFTTDGKFVADEQRDSEYTKLLSEVIIKDFYQENMVLSSHLIAFVAFEMLLRRHNRLDLYGVLRLHEEDRRIPYDTFIETVDKIRNVLKTMHDNDQVNLGTAIHSDINRLIDHGLRNLGVYHSKKPLVRSKSGDYMSSEDMNLLYYYHNRLLGYELEKLI